ncbi:MAG TPA: toxin TcdB middle/N-terminal domain-containing protein, partial [Candidatus Cryosericum sp.]|nr:toxin TcdB middle/N-terminal domain-containing protein [Candidatus Cryosericum sp.]
MNFARRCLIWGEGSAGTGCPGAATPRRPVPPLSGDGTRALAGLLLVSLLGSGQASGDEAGDPLRDGPASPPGAPSIAASLGAATVRFPIEVPPGRHGMAPGIALRYNSAAGNGNSGYGFSLGLGSIERSTRFGSPHFDDTDTFVLVLGGDSLELVPVDAGSTRFRTAIDSGYLVERLTPGPFGAGSCYWMARGRDGRRYRFGFMGGTDNPSQAGNLSWGLDRVEDASGNVMEIVWNASGLHLYPARIEYASHPVRGLLPSNRVEFCWEERGDQAPGPAGDRLTHRLRQIRTFASDRRARAYTFEYDAPGNPTSALGVCRPDASPGAGSGNPDLPPPGPTPPPRRPPGEGPILEGGRLDGGRVRTLTVAEAVTVPPTGLPSTSSHLVRVLRGDGAGGFLAPIEYRYTADPNPGWPLPGGALLPPLPFFYAQPDADEDSGVRLVDLNRDGRLDLVQLEGRQEGFVWSYSAAAYLNAGDAFAYSAAWTAGLLGLVNAADASRSASFVIKRGTRDRVENGVRFLDVNDDGFPDVVRSVLWFGQGLRKSVFLNTGSGFVLDPASAAALPDEPFADVHADPSRDVSEDRGVRTADVNNDGRADLLVSRAEWGGPSERRTYLYDRGAYRLDPRWTLPDEPFVRHVPHGRTLDMGVRILELNGDGFPDLVRAANVDGFVQTAAYLNTARPDPSAPAWVATTRYGTLGVFADHFVQISSAGDGVSYDRGLRVADIDGNGRSDILAARQWNGGPIEKYLYTTSAEGPWTYRVIDQFPWVFVSKPAGGPPRDQGARIADLDGDGGIDALVSQPGGLRQWRPNRAWQGRLLLTSYSNGLGGTTEIAYVPAPHGGSIEGGFPAALPFPLAVVGAVTTKDGLGHAYTTRYDYDGGFYHHAGREFRGFRRVTALPPGGVSSTETLFLQQPGLRHAPLRGEPEATVVRRAADGAVYSRTAAT